MSEITIPIVNYIDAFDDIDELKKAAKILLRQNSEWLDDYERENENLKSQLEKYKQANKVLMGAVEAAIKQSEKSCQLDGCTCVSDGLRIDLTEVKRIMEDD